MNNPSTRTTVAGSLFWIILILVLGWGGGTAAALGCGENLHPGTTRAGVCNGLGLSDFGSVGWLIYASVPVVVFIVLLLTPWGRTHLGRVGKALAIATIAFNAVVLVLVT
jgi:hypothetical protein